MSEPQQDGPRYVLVESDRFEADFDRLTLGSNRFLGPERANEWSQGLRRAIDALTSFPGPLSHARDEEALALYGREVRRLLYYGPTRRRTGMPVRVLFTLLPPAPDDPGGETVIFLLRLLHGPQSLTPPEETA